MTGPASDAALAPVRRPRADTARTADLTSWDAPGWAGLRVVVTGLGVTGFSVADTLAELGAAVVVVDGDDGPENRARAETLRIVGVREVLLDRAATQVLPEVDGAAADLVVTSPGWRPDQPLRVVMIGTDFEVRVWETLLKIPMGRAVSYSDIACNINSPKASRAVGAAVGRNPVSFVVPCHRALGKSGALTGYHWGITRKQAMLGWEAGQLGVQ